jgi:Ser/Thr protein kinase RdoA (MazF antagonist)
MRKDAVPDPGGFSHLTPDHVLDLVEEALGRRCTSLCRPLTSYINRVYEVELEDGSRVVAKFYRPGRWSPEALQDEQDFLGELSGDEIPVIAPLPFVDGTTLQNCNGMYYAVFPKRGGRALDEPDAAQWGEIGRLLARVHVVGARHGTRDRIHMAPDASTEDHIQGLLDDHIGRPDLCQRFEETVDAVLDLIEPLFEGVENIRIHGDCHRNNMLWRPGEPLSLIDFDDMASGPAVQDLWMLLPGRLQDAAPEASLLLDGYETFRTFNRAELRLIEPLRFMRMIHYLAWCARQQDDGGFSRLSPDWGSGSFWQAEIDNLNGQHQAILEALSAPLPAL